MVNVGIVGVTGYTGQELVRILLKHPKVKISGLFSRSSHGKYAKELFPEIASDSDLVCQKAEVKSISSNCDLVFLALPHKSSMELVPGLIRSGIKVVDLSADYRLKDVKIYEKFYDVKHKDSLGVKGAVYGLPELYRDKIKNAKLLANPGCYPTAALLSLAPLMLHGKVDLSSIIIDAKSGISGAGKQMAEGSLLKEAIEDFRAYKVGVHQHAPEINQELSKMSGKKVGVVFVPHLLPIKRGILETIYLKKGKSRQANLVKVYEKFYRNETFVRIKNDGSMPRIKDVVNTNFCDIGIKEEKSNIILVSVIDNLLKGASGQAVQNMNIMCGFPEATGLM